MSWFPRKDPRLYARTPAIVTEVQQQRANTERLMVLGGIGNENPIWQMVLSYADEHARNELSMALMPSLNDCERQYNAGRAASAEDFATALRDLKIKAEREAKR